MSKKVLEGLNPAQKDAIHHSGGPLLVLAGAGSGKTRVIAHRFAYLAGKVPAGNILTVTFTNRAAEEMKGRIAGLTKKDIRSAWVGTFHSQCSKILRREIHALGYSNDFSILDDDDQSSLIRHILKEFKMYEALYKGVLSRIALLKASAVGPEEFLSRGDVFGFEDKLARVYVRYRDEMKKCNGLDFDDLILLCIRLFEEEPKALKKYRSIFQHVLVDEFQDTNHAQYRLLKLIAGGHRNICAVGDDDQSIYGFRGANCSNILSFEKDFSGTKVVRLEQNYRSTQLILDAAGEVIKKNAARYPKKLVSEKKQGEKVCLCNFDTDDEESRYIAKAIREMYLKGCDYKDFAVLYRVNIQSRTIEEALRKEGLPYRIVAGVGFYQRREIKDLMAYIRLAANNDNNVSLRRIINCPPRGIGASTMSKIEQIAKKKSISLFAAMKEILKSNGVTQAIKDKIGNFITVVEGFTNQKFKDARDMLRHIYKETGYGDFVTDEGLGIVKELLASAEGVGVKDFIDRASLFSNEDLNDGNAVFLMTLHAAKGLEFPVVFIVGLEEGVLPYFKAKTPEELAEERKLLYVGMTRAKDVLWLTSAKKRRLYTKFQEQQVSRFMRDMPMEFCRKIERVMPAPVRQPIAEKVKTFKPPSYFVGLRVKHPAWGVGVVRDCCGEGDDQKVTVNFPTVGVKRLAPRFANLERL